MVWMFSSIFVSCMICTFIIKKAHIVNWSWVIIIQFLCREHIWRGGTQKRHKKYFFLSCIFCIAAAAVFYSFSKYCRQQRLRGQYRMDFWTKSVYLLFKLCWWSIILDFQLSFFTVNRIILSWQHVCEFFIIFLIIISINVVFRIRNFFSDRVTNICVIVSSYFSNRLISRFSFYSLPGRLLLMLSRFLGWDIGCWILTYQKAVWLDQTRGSMCWSMGRLHIG